MSAIKKLIIIVFMLSSNSTFANPLNGVWGGVGEQDDGSVWSIKMSISGDKYVIDYPSIPCSGILELLTYNHQTYTFIEEITDNLSECVNFGMLQVSIEDNQNLYWQWYYPQGELGVETRLKKYDSIALYKKDVNQLLNKTIQKNLKNNAK